MAGGANSISLSAVTFRFNFASDGALGQGQYRNAVASGQPKDSRELNALEPDAIALRY